MFSDTYTRWRPLEQSPALGPCPQASLDAPPAPSVGPLGWVSACVPGQPPSVGARAQGTGGCCVAGAPSCRPRARLPSPVEPPPPGRPVWFQTCHPATHLQGSAARPQPGPPFPSEPLHAGVTLLTHLPAAALRAMQALVWRILGVLSPRGSLSGSRRTVPGLQPQGEDPGPQAGSGTTEGVRKAPEAQRGQEEGHPPQSELGQSRGAPHACAPPALPLHTDPEATVRAVKRQEPGS
ncbi:protein enabled homolog [Mustela erminea]|uniref:protein enabled homolog n=1 Tax=Mustela erminea TaxID=36723 RepID=UPI001387465A|nr:protein enabled homolog [Mustela erminea]